MISIIVAISENGIIGAGNAMPWHISEDFAHFKAVTLGHPVVMGRKTFESIGRPLPQRRNIIISRQNGLTIDGCEVVGSLEEAIALLPKDEEIFIIGGGEIYRQAMPIADKLYITHIHKTIEGDTAFPTIDDSWAIVSKEEYSRGKEFTYPFDFVEYTKI